MNIGEVLAEQLRRTREWTLKLLADFSGEEWLFQPKPGLQHALWLCGHLAVSQDVLLFQRCLGQAAQLDSTFSGLFSIGGPIQSKKDRSWPEHGLVLEKMVEMQTRTEQAVERLTKAFLLEPAFGKDGSPHPHYDTKLGAIGHIGRHEAFHAGQLALIRRMLGKSFLR